MKKTVFIAKEYDQKVAQATALAALNCRVTLLVFDQLQPIGENSKIEILTPYQNISPLLLIRLIPFFINLQADVFHFITPTNMSWIEKTNWAFYISLLSSFRGPSVIVTSASELTPNRLLLAEVAAASRGQSPQGQGGEGFDILIPHSLGGLTLPQWEILSEAHQAQARMLAWGWGDTPIHQRHKLRKKFEIHNWNLTISNPSIDEKRRAFANTPGLMIFNFQDGLFTEADLAQRATQKNVRIYFDRPLMESLRAPWRDSVNCFVLSRSFHCLKDLALSWSNEGEVLSFFDQEENIQLRKWSLDAQPKLR